MTCAARSPAPALLERIEGRGERGAQCWHDAEDERRQERERDREHDDPSVDVDRFGAGQGVARHRQQQLHRPVRQQQAERAADPRENKAFGDELPHHARGAGAECRADRDFALARSGAGQHQVGDVGAADQQHDADRTHQHEDHPAAAADHLVLERPRRQRQLGREASEDRRITFDQGLDEDAELGARLFNRDASR